MHRYSSVEINKHYEINEGGLCGQYFEGFEIFANFLLCIKS